MIQTMKDIPKEERPYEKVIHSGASVLSDAELLAVLLRTGAKGTSALELARTVLSTEDKTTDLLLIHHLTYEQLLSIDGIGKVKAIQILCLSELSKRLAKAEAKEGLIFSHPEAIAKYYMEDMRHGKQEQIKLLMLDTKSKLIHETNVSKGTVNASMISPRELFIEALQRNAVSIILLHNHPSGDPTPSENDILLTNRVKQTGDMIGIELLDHIIIGNNCYVSFLESKLI